MNLEKSMELVLEELRGLQVGLHGVNERLDGVDQRLDGIDLRLDGVDQRLDGIDQRLDGVDQRLDSLEQGQADILEQQREHTVLIHALIDGQTSLERKIAESQADCNQKIAALSERVYACEQATSRNAYDIALLKASK